VPVDRPDFPHGIEHVISISSVSPPNIRCADLQVMKRISARRPTTTERSLPGVSYGSLGPFGCLDLRLILNQFNSSSTGILPARRCVGLKTALHRARSLLLTTGTGCGRDNPHDRSLRQDRCSWQGGKRAGCPGMCSWRRTRLRSCARRTGLRVPNLARPSRSRNARLIFCRSA
jgi:hypothetical protein